VSLTAEPKEEVRVGWEILRAAGLRQRGPQIISCPTCGRIAYDLIGKIGEIEKRIQHLTSPFTLAVMGCEVNGPGEAKDADLGICGGGDKAALYKKGKLLRVVSFDNFIDEIVSEAEKLDAEMGGKNK
jgi:(E)-4-hydroxy-3-methylbut-2-enyl-diphosphate synthase